MWCPSRDLPKYSNAAGSGDVGYARPFYTCILGANTHSSTDSTGSQGRGAISDGGVITLQRGQRISAITDGTSNTAIVGEQSDWVFSGGGARTDARVDNDRGFHMGTSYVTYPAGQGTMETGNTCPHNNCQRCYNTTTVNAQGLNAKTGLGGIHLNQLACNRPLQSAHPGGVNLLFADGHVAFLTNGLPLATLKNLVNRDDGNVINLP
jgi:prepilin-type processing-associated H-X9-DG protein